MCVPTREGDTETPVTSALSHKTKITSLFLVRASWEVRETSKKCRKPRALSFQPARRRPRHSAEVSENQRSVEAVQEAPYTSSAPSGRSRYLLHTRENVSRVFYFSPEYMAEMRRSASTTRMAGAKGGGGCGDSVLPLVKEWYTLVKLDESGGIGHIVSDGELEELEMLILSGTQDADGSEANDSVSMSLSGGDGDSRDSGGSEDTAAETEDTSGPLRTALTMYTKPGGPCDHCSAVGTSRPGILLSFSSPLRHQGRARPRLRCVPTLPASRDAPRWPPDTRKVRRGSSPGYCVRVPVPERRPRRGCRVSFTLAGRLSGKPSR